MQTVTPRLQSWIYSASRSRSFLWKVALALLALGAAVGYLGSSLQPTGPWNLGSRVVALGGGSLSAPADDDSWTEFASDGEAAQRVSIQIAAALAEQLQDPAITLRDVIAAVPQLARTLRPSEYAQVDAIVRRRFSDREADLIGHYLAGMATRASSAAAALERLATAGQATPYSAYAWGRVELKRKEYAAAARAFQLAGQDPDAWSSRSLALHALIQARDFDTIARLREVAAYAPLFNRRVLLDLAITQRDWRAIVRWSPLIQLETFETRVLAITLLVGAAWAFFLWHLAEAPKLSSGFGLLCVTGFVLGALSTIPTVYAVIWQDEILKLGPGTTLPQTLLYYFAAVGVREELCKLLLFVPLLPFLLRRDDEFEALMVASFVGLGFAIEENGNYFLRSEASVVAGRFLTANFFHTALTGVSGLALFRACARGTAGLNDLLAMLPMAIAAHGLYDAALSLPQLDDTGFIAMIIFIGFSTVYFNRVHQLRHQTRTTIGLTGSFVLAVSAVAGTMIAFQMLNLGAEAGAILMASELLGSAILLFMFFREFREPLAE